MLASPYGSDCAASMRHTARDAGMAGASDAEQLAYATGRRAMIVTLRFAGFRGCIEHRTLRIAASSPYQRRWISIWQEIRAAMLIDWAATLPDHRSQLFRWHDLQQRLIGGVRLPGYSEEDVRLALGQIS